MIDKDPNTLYPEVRQIYGTYVLCFINASNIWFSSENFDVERDQTHFFKSFALGFIEDSQTQNYSPVVLFSSLFFLQIFHEESENVINAKVVKLL